MLRGETPRNKSKSPTGQEKTEMARGQVAEQNDTTEDGEVSGGSKRERVDLATLADDARVPVSFFAPAGLKRALLARAAELEITYTAMVRDWIAERMEYQIPESFSQRERRHTYANEEERKAATAERGKQQRAAMKELLSSVSENEELLATLRASGVNVDALLKK
jgi:hypothetical protein